MAWHGMASRGMAWHGCRMTWHGMVHDMPPFARLALPSGYPLSPNGVLRGRVVPMLPGKPLLGCVAAPCLCRWVDSETGTAAAMGVESVTTYQGSARIACHPCMTALYVRSSCLKEA